LEDTIETTVVVVGDDGIRVLCGGGRRRNTSWTRRILVFL